MCELKECLTKMKALFDKHAGGEGKTMTKSKLKGLFQDKMGECEKNAKNPDDVKKFYKRMDENPAEEVTFADFMMALGLMASAVNGWKYNMPECCK